MPTITDWVTAWAAVSADLLSFAAGAIALRALHWNRRAAQENKRAADEARRSADAAALQVSLMRPRPLVLAGYVSNSEKSARFTFRNIGTGTAFDVGVSDLVLPNGPAISTNPLPYLETGAAEPGTHRFVRKGFWSEVASESQRSDLQVFISYFSHHAFNPDGNLSIPVLIRYRSATGECFQTELELRMDKRWNVVRLFPKDSLIGRT